METKSCDKNEYQHSLNIDNKRRRCAVGYRIDGLLTVFIEKKRKPVVMSREEFVNRGGRIEEG